jgi:hypothetical protein
MAFHDTAQPHQAQITQVRVLRGLTLGLVQLILPSAGLPAASVLGADVWQDLPHGGRAGGPADELSTDCVFWTSFQGGVSADLPVQLIQQQLDGNGASFEDIFLWAPGPRS